MQQHNLLHACVFRKQFLVLSAETEIVLIMKIAADIKVKKSSTNISYLSISKIRKKNKMRLFVKRAERTISFLEESNIVLDRIIFVVPSSNNYGKKNLRHTEKRKIKS